MYWRKTGKEDREARNSLYASSARGAWPAVVNRARCPETLRYVQEGRLMLKAFSSEVDAGRASTSTSAPVIVPWRAVIALMMSRGDR